MAARVSLLALCAAMLPALAAESGLPDPTRPPMTASVGGNPGVAAAPVLQSVVLPRSGPARATIDGTSIRLGETHDGARLVRVSEVEAVLDGPAGRQVLRLTPAVRKETAGGKRHRGSQP